MLLSLGSAWLGCRVIVDGAVVQLYVRLDESGPCVAVEWHGVQTCHSPEATWHVIHPVSHSGGR